ncbi:hypothetical protein KP509_11G016900 [Ceratopteris richardii]|nr:hypothetical protein KP509_11G016900 [Ceratopteris richardii]
MIQAGPLLDIHMPRDKETKRHKGYAFAEFTNEKSAQYAVSLFSGLVFLQKKLLRFSISGQDKQLNSQERPPFLEPLAASKSEGSNSQRTSSFAQISPGNAQISPGLLSSLGGNNGFSGAGQRLNFSPLAHTQGYNARSLPAGQFGLRPLLNYQDHLYDRGTYLR